MHSLAGRRAVAPWNVEPVLSGQAPVSAFGAEELVADLGGRLGEGSGWCAEVRPAGTVVPPTVTSLLEAGFHAVLVDDWRDDRSLDDTLREGGAPRDLDALVIDVDHTDVERWQGLARFRPRLVSVGYDPSVPNDVLGRGSIRSVVSAARAMGYGLVGTTLVSAVFVRGDLLFKLDLDDSSADALRPERHSLELTPAAVGGHA